MCGIAGIVTPRGQQREMALDRMLAALHHRGPDSAGTHAFDSCILGNTRLSIIDIDGGRQPIFAPAANAAITFNGEIYGYKELRESLRDYPFRTHADTEVVLALYVRHGREFLRQLPGMFAFALWDDRRQELVCARDRFGEKPFYYAFSEDGAFVCASEIKAILASGLINPILNLEAVSHCLKHGYVHPHQTIYRNVQVLPPAHFLSLYQGRLKIQRYWDFPATDGTFSLSEAVDRFKLLFEAAVGRQLEADVPVGALLSGGVDSSTVVAIASRFKPGLETFSFGFRDGIDSELPYARQIAEKYHTRHFEVCEEHTDLPDLLHLMQEIYDEPFADSSNIPTYLISKAARERVKVVLTGDGADELLGGYFFWSRGYLRQASEADRGRRSIWLARLLRLAQRLRRNTVVRNDAWRRGKDLVRRYGGFRCYFSPEEEAQLGLLLQAEHVIPYARYSTGTLNDILRMDMEGYLCGDILVKTDRAAMANSLELRSPFLDVDLANYCLSLPEHFKVDDEREKILLREAYEHLWSAEIRQRHKQGFGGPMKAWLQLDAMCELKHTYLEDRRQRIFDILSFDGLQPFLARDNQQTWTLLVLALWMERHHFGFS